MKRRNEQTLQDVIKVIIKQYGLEQKFEQIEISQIWGEMLGPSVAKVTRNVKFDKGVVTVYLDSSLVKQELNMHRSRLAGALNEAIGKNIVTDVLLR